MKDMRKLSVDHSTTSFGAIEEISKSRSAWCGANHMPPIEKSGFLIIPATRLSTKPYTLRTQMCVIENNCRGILALQHPSKVKGPSKIRAKTLSRHLAYVLRLEMGNRTRR